MGRFLGHTYNIPLFKIPQIVPPPLGYRDGETYHPRNDLYNLATDPEQAQPLTDPATEAHLCDLMREHFARVAAPQEQAERLGL